ncbi:hypothetical protein AB0L62_12800 [Nocardia asteroides]
MLDNPRYTGYSVWNKQRKEPRGCPSYTRNQKSH